MSLPPNTSIYLVGAGFLFSLYANIQGWAEKRYLKRRNKDVAYRFVVDMATNHLPHIYECLRLLGTKLGAEIGDVPPIQFVQFTEEQDASIKTSNR